MLYDYELIEVKPKLNKKKVCIIVLIVIIVISVSIYGAIKYLDYTEGNKQNQDIGMDISEEDRIKIEEENKLAEEKRKQEEKKLLINNQPFLEEQMQAIENIYSSDGKRVFLTFDDGPTQLVTPLILDVLKEEDIKATFFVLGNRVQANPEIVKRAYDEGHYIANHGYTHNYSLIYKSPQTVMDEYNITEGYIKEVLGNPEYSSKVFRFPGGSSGGKYANLKKETKQVMRENGIVSLDWNALSRDADGSKTQEEIMNSVIQTVGEKQSVVILMHDSYDKILTYESLREVILYLRDKGYEFMTLYDIL